MGEKNEKTPREFLLDLIASDMNLARAFAAVSRSAYQLGKREEGDFARLKAVQLYSEAAKLTSQVPEAEKEGIGYELQTLSISINWLFMAPLASPPLQPHIDEHLAVDSPIIAVEEN
jgi:hypothetical protein